MVVYYVDGKICAISDAFVPNLESDLWLGVSFQACNSFVGFANFEKDVMEVDYVKYIPFLNQPYEKFEPEFVGVANENQYPGQERV
ncbi:MAG: hypothetical protein V8R16_07785 [Bacilli bacterium]